MRRRRFRFVYRLAVDGPYQYTPLRDTLTRSQTDVPPAAADAHLQVIDDDYHANNTAAASQGAAAGRPPDDEPGQS